MHLDGSHILNAPPQQVWNLILDPDVLARATPGVKTLSPLGDDKYDAVFEVKMGPVSGQFKGSMEVVDKIEPESFKLKMKMNGKIGNVAAAGNLQLAGTGNNQTEVTFSGDAKLTGTLARTGQRVLSGVAKTMTSQFFKSLEEELAASKGAVEKIGFFAKIANWFKRLFGAKKAEAKEKAKEKTGRY